MKTHYLIPASDYTEEIIIKRSQFITYLGHVENREAAEAFIRERRQQHPKANHVCWAYIAGAPDTTVTSMSDDGEPSGTAGRPMLNVLQHSELGEVIAAVVRYFGGTKLGTGGLQRAYAGGVRSALEQLPTIEKIPQQAFQLTVDYALESSTRHLFTQFNASLLQCDYQQQIIMDGTIAIEQFTPFCLALQDRSAGNIEIHTFPD